MLRPFISILILCLPAGAAAGAPSAHDRLKEMLGKDFNGAKVVARRGNDVATFDLKTMTIKTLASFSSGGRFEGLSRPCWSADGKQIVFAHGGKAFSMNADGTNRRRILADQPRVYEPVFWDNPHTGERCVVFKDRNAKDWYGDGNPGKTLLYQPQKRRVLKIADFPCDGGLSRDGTHLGDAYAGCLILDISRGIDRGKYHVLNRGEPADDASMSPDNTYRIMHLYPSRTHVCIRDKTDKELWRGAAPPEDRQWFTPRFSNHPDFFTAVLVPGDHPAVVEIDTKKIVPITELGDGWSAPHLWLPSAAGVASDDGAEPEPPPPAGPIDDLELKNLAYYKRMVAGADCYTPLLADLAAMQNEPESLKIVEALEAYGNDKLQAAQKSENVLEAAAVYRELAVKFNGHMVGKFAKQLLDAPAFQKEIVAAELLQELLDLQDRLRPAPGGGSHCDNHDFLLRNRATIALMSKVSSSILDNFADTKAGKTAGEIVGKYRIPEKITGPANVSLVVDATLERASKVPDAPEIAGRGEALVYLVYRVDKVVSGGYGEPRISVVTWGLRNRQPTPAAQWKPGLRQRLTLDLFDHHRELHRKPAGDDAKAADLTPYWLNRIGRPARTWVDATGEFRVEAQMVAVKQGWVRLRKNDGSEISIPLAKLSRADQQYVAGQ